MTPSAHARLDGGGLRGGELVVELPLQPAVKVDGVGVLGGEGRRPLDASGWRSSSGHSCQSLPYFSASAHQVAKSSRLRPSRSRYAAYASSRPGGSLDAGTRSRSAARLAFHAASRSIRLAFFGRRLRLDTRLADAAALPDVGELVDRLDAQIQRIDEPARRRQVRRRLHRRGGSRRVQRVDQDKYPAPCREADHTARSVRSVKSPMPQERFERTL